MLSEKARDLVIRYKNLSNPQETTLLPAVPIFRAVSVPENEPGEVGAFWKEL